MKAREESKKIKMSDESEKESFESLEKILKIATDHLESHSKIPKSLQKFFEKIIQIATYHLENRSQIEEEEKAAVEMEEKVEAELPEEEELYEELSVEEAEEKAAKLREDATRLYEKAAKLREKAKLCEQQKFHERAAELWVEVKLRKKRSRIA